ncbi:hypothetical protein KIN20_021114 [Parelaphostrongylus tenuis]|uniref:Uncharacterized protein n=1 Tax=Parelaphostrongylus tenuis TaxID=148309 RepID=A0AAD5N4W1_PARTN|nr:hypothetical protein KIN20_021108 [Parelaphostrongylus tenuis]KAJ1361777.1 hypothetical protein KIN20_021114 [Parelaphostrongylus tenuis]
MVLSVALKRAAGSACMHLVDFLSTKSVQRTLWAFQSVDDIHGSDGLSFRVFTVGGSTRNDVLHEDLEDTTAPAIAVFMGNVPSRCTFSDSVLWSLEAGLPSARGKASSWHLYKFA